ncbi:hypothetical protein [Halapricum desulfuricans]|uniref:Uncharacterized protein n=1 Tax=Halapricum desulfuricans TaxID=2841257 RepID=A0A897MW68_9EURY|nr:hypothetical protein [Halapricum desulfuricans]QSG06360.1 hypothetical protein HSR121_2028 [Halapricum desulfuricans]
MIDETETVSIDVRPLAQHIIFAAREFGDWQTHFPENLANEDDPWDAIRLSNVDYVESYGDSIEIGGRFEVPVVIERIRGTRWNPPEVRTKQREAFFTIHYHFEDEGFADGEIEVI